LFGTECSIVTIGITGTTYDHQYIHTPKEKVGKIMMMVKEEFLVKNGCKEAKGKTFSSNTSTLKIKYLPVMISRHFTPL
jgi:hypothetical protein